MKRSLARRLIGTALAAGMSAGSAWAGVSEATVRPAIEIPGFAAFGAASSLYNLGAMDALSGRALDPIAARLATAEPLSLTASRMAALNLAATPRLAAPISMPALTPAVSARPMMGGLRESTLEIQRAISAGKTEQADQTLKRWLDGADKGGNGPTDAGNGGSNLGGGAGGSNGGNGSGGGSNQPGGDLPEPSVHLEAAKRAVAPDAELIGAYAPLGGAGRKWTYALLSRSVGQIVFIEVDQAGQTRLSHSMPIPKQVPTSIDLSRIITLRRAVEIATRAGFTPLVVALGPSIHGGGRTVFEFVKDGFGGVVQVDAVTGELLDGLGHPLARTTSIGTPEQIAELNKAVAEVLTPFNDKLTKAEVVFSKVATNDVRAVDVAVSAKIDKTGANDRLVLDVKNLSYSYPEAPGSAPGTNSDVSLKLNLLNLLSQEEMDKLGPQADEYVKYFIRDAAKQYGQAATVDAKVGDITRDAAGHLTGLTLSLSLDVDLSKLPPGKTGEYIYVTRARATIRITTSGLDVVVDLTHNPNARVFQRGRKGLKELLDALLTRDARILREIADLIKTLNGYAKNILDQKRRN